MAETGPMKGWSHWTLFSHPLGQRAFRETWKVILSLTWPWSTFPGIILEHYYLKLQFKGDSLHSSISVSSKQKVVYHHRGYAQAIGWRILKGECRIL